MTEKTQRDTAFHDGLGDEEREARLRYSNVANKKKDRKGGGRGPAPVGTGGASSSPGASAAGGVGPAGPAAGSGAPHLGAAPQSAAGISLTGAAAADGVSPAGALPGDEVRFDGDPLAAGDFAPEADDPWGAYDNPENVPGLTLDEEEEGPLESDPAMALRGSGTRGDSKNKGGGRMAPVMPMGGGGGGAGGGAAAGGPAAPGATLGGVSGAPNAAGQPGALAGMGAGASAPATSATMAPPASGVAAAGGEESGLNDPSLRELAFQQGVDPDSPYIMGPDGQMYPNPYYRGDSGDNGHLPPEADFNGDGIISDDEARRWRNGQDRTNDGGGDDGRGDGDGDGTEGSGDDGGGHDGDLDLPPINPDPDFPERPRPDPDEDGVKDPPKDDPDDGTDPPRNPRDNGGDDGGDGNGNGNGDDSPIVHNPPPPTTPPPDGNGNTYPKSYPDGPTKVGNPGTDYRVKSDELVQEAKTWQQLAAEQEKLAKDIQGMPNDPKQFGVLDNMPTAYRKAQASAAEATMQSGARSGQSSAHLKETASSYEANEAAGIEQAGGIDN